MVVKSMVARQNLLRRPCPLQDLSYTIAHEVSRSAKRTIFHDTYVSCYSAKMQIGVCDVMGELPVEPAFAFQNSAKSSKPFDYKPGLLHVIIVAKTSSEQTSKLPKGGVYRGVVL